MNNAVESILHLNERRLSFYTGGYDRFEETRREQQRLAIEAEEAQDDARKKMEAFVERFRAKATKAKQAQSRLKALSKMQPIAAEVDQQVVPFAFPRPSGRLAIP